MTDNRQFGQTLTRKLAVCSLVCLLLACSAKPTPKAKGAAGDSNGFGRARVELNAQRWLNAIASKAKDAGASDVQIVALEAGAPGDRVSGMLQAPENDCVVVLARGSQSVHDVDLFVYGDDGSALGSDEAQDKTPTLLICPPHPPRLYVSARVALGHGLVVVGAQRVAPEKAQEVGRAVHASNLPEANKHRLEVWPGLEDMIAEHRRLIGAQWQDVRRVALPLDARIETRISAAIDQDGCIDALVVPSDEVSHLDMSVMDQTGRTIGRAAATGRARSLIVCSATPDSVTFEVRPHSGQGLAAFILSHTIEDSAIDIDVQAPRVELTGLLSLEQQRKRHKQRLLRWGYPSPQAGPEGSLVIGEKASVSLDLRSGCTRVDVLAGAPASGIAAWLWSAEGSLVAQERGHGSATLFACVPESKLRLDLEALTRPGPFLVELRTDTETPNELNRHPLAASRLLARMARTGVLRSTRQLGAPNAIELSPVKLHRADVLVPVGRCLDVSLALGPGAEGAEIRLIELGTDKELGLSRGTYATSLRVCGFDRRGTVHASLELLANSGHTTGLYATRLLSPKP